MVSTLKCVLVRSCRSTWLVSHCTWERICPFVLRHIRHFLLFLPGPCASALCLLNCHRPVNHVGHVVCNMSLGGKRGREEPGAGRYIRTGCSLVGWYSMWYGAHTIRAHTSTLPQASTSFPEGYIDILELVFPPSLATCKR
eukprot:jgi/Botrbrau1/9211/Bobra.0028s0007.1